MHCVCTLTRIKSIMRCGRLGECSAVEQIWSEFSTTATSAKCDCSRSTERERRTRGYDVVRAGQSQTAIEAVQRETIKGSEIRSIAEDHGYIHTGEHRRHMQRGSSPERNCRSSWIHVVPREGRSEADLCWCPHWGMTDSTVDFVNTGSSGQACCVTKCR